MQYFITVRKRSCGKVMFLHLSVSHSVHRGLSASVHSGIHTPMGRHPPWAHTTPLGRQPPTPGQTTPGLTPPRQTPPVHAGIHSPPWADSPPVHAGIHSPPAQCMLGYTAPLSSACWDTHPPVQFMLGWTWLLLRMLRILLECILVFNTYPYNYLAQWCEIHTCITHL